ncbi:MAG: hypothetical protein C4K60_17545 [Ideonella sp. MAG2]|nr:MAG: hypothetical protein C4K60_17545 [Ideonella sp. MAG2]
MNRIAMFASVLLALLILAAATLFVVDQRQVAVVYSLGEIKEVITEPGLKVKLPPPFQNVVFLDRRIQTLDSPETRPIFTAEKKSLVIDWLVKWRIKEPRQFIRNNGADMRNLENRLSPVVQAAFNEEVTKRTVGGVLATEREKVMQDVQARLADEAKSFGIEILDVRIKRVDFVASITESVYRRMESERKQVANELRSKGQAESEKIRADADRQREVIVAEAYRDAQKVMGEGDAEASATYAAAFGRDPQFAQFYRSLEAYRATWRNKSDVMVVEPNSDFYDLKTFKLVDQLSGRTLGLRADTTPQVARIDAHLLNRQGVTRLCYCGPVLHTKPQGSQSTREQLQLGAEIFGHAGLEADLEIQELALGGLQAAGVKALTIDLGDARIVRAVLAGLPLDAEVLTGLVSALTTKDRSLVKELASACPVETRDALLALLDLYGGPEVLVEAARVLPQRPLVKAALADLGWISGHVSQAYPEVRIGFDLSDMSGYAYYSGLRFAVYAQGAASALARGGRYDEVGAVFGRNRPAVGFSLDLRNLVASAAVPAARAAITAPWAEDAGLRAAVRELRAQGETVLCILPGHEHEAQEFECDRELVQAQGQWLLRAR